jgi:hypothetical protein
MTYVEVAKSLHAAGEVEQVGGYLILHDLDRAFSDSSMVEKHAILIAEAYWKGMKTCNQQ